MKKLLALLAVFVFAFALSACADGESYEDGRYRGVYDDQGENQVTIQFDLEDNIIVNIRFRSLDYRGVDYLDDEANETIQAIKDQHQEAIDYLIGKDIREALVDLYDPEAIGNSDVSDALTGATIRSNKIVSAIRDALNRGVYSYLD